VWLIESGLLAGLLLGRQEAMRAYTEPEAVTQIEKAAGNLWDRLLIQIPFRLGGGIKKASTDHRASSAVPIAVAIS